MLAPMREPSPWVVVAVLASAAVIGGVVLYRSSHSTPPAPPKPPPPAQAVETPPADQALPTAQASDAKLQGLLGTVSPRAEVQEWLKSGDLLNRSAIVLDNLAEGVTPRKQLAILAPKGDFSAEQRGSLQVISAQSYQRYDFFGDAVASVDAQALAKALRELHPLLEAAYHQLGYPQTKLDEVLAKAARRIIAAPLQQGAVAVEKAGALWFYADPALEKAGGVEKHLLRMGPRNEKLIQDKVREVAAALGIALAATAPAAPAAPAPAR